MQGLEDLIEPVAEATSSGNLIWEEDGTGFTANVGSYKIVTWRWTDENDGTSGVSASLKQPGPFGTVLDTLVANEFSTRYDRLSEFFNVARRSALNVDSIVAMLKQDLKALGSR